VDRVSLYAVIVSLAGIGLVLESFVLIFLSTLALVAVAVLDYRHEQSSQAGSEDSGD
jgi:hypothetical protein